MARKEIEDPLSFLDFSDNANFEYKDSIVDMQSIVSDSSTTSSSSEKSLCLSLPDSFDITRLGSDEYEYGHNTLQKVLRMVNGVYNGRDIMNKLLEGNQPVHPIENFSNHLCPDLHLRNEIERLQKLLSHEKDMFRDLYISRATYDELIIRPEEDLSLKEFVCLRVEELANVHRITAEKNAVELQKALRSLDGTAGTVQTQAAEIARLTTQVQLMGESHEREIATVTEQRRRLQDQLHRLEEENKSMYGASSKLEELTKESVAYLDEVKGLRTALRDQTQTLLHAQESEIGLRQQVADQQRQLEMRRLDLDYLHAQLREARRQADDRARAAESSESKAGVLEGKVSELSDKLISLQVSSSAETQCRLDREIERIRSEMRAEAQAVRDTQRESSDREMRAMQELRLSLELELENSRRRADRLAEDLVRVTTEATTKVADRDREVSDLRAEVKLRTFELTAVRVTLEERSACVRGHELELQYLRDQQTAYKAAFSRLEEEYRQETSALQRALETLETRHQSNEKSDNFRKSDHDASASTAAHAEIENLKRALALSRQCESKARNEVDAMRAQICAGDKDAVVSYLTSRLREMEADALTATGRVSDLDGRVIELSCACDRKDKEVAQLRERLQCVLSQRAEVSSVRLLLEEYLEGSDTEDTDPGPPPVPVPQAMSARIARSGTPAAVGLSPSQLQQLTVHRGSTPSAKGWHRREILTHRRPTSNSEYSPPL